MSKIIISAVIAFTSVVVFADSTTIKTTPSAKSPQENAARAEAILRKTGGFISRKSDGKILFINCQSRISEEELNKRVDRIRFVLKYPCEVIKGTWKLGDNKPKDAKIAIYLVDDEKLPMSLVAVESGWGVINTATLTEKNNRFSKQLTRVFCLTAGGADSPVKTSPMQTVMKSEDLDKLLTDGFTFDMASSINENLQALGMHPERKVPYIKAVKEGWAPAPTNDIQKAIWDKVHAAPKNPIKIEFDPKKGR